MKPHLRLALRSASWALWVAKLTGPLGYVQVAAQWTHGTHRADCEIVLNGVTRALNPCEQLFMDRAWLLSYNTRWEDWEDWSTWSDEQWDAWEVENEREFDKTTLLDVVHMDVSMEDYDPPLQGGNRSSRQLRRKSNKLLIFKSSMANLVSCRRCTDRVRLIEDAVNDRRNYKQLSNREAGGLRWVRRLQDDDQAAFIDKFCSMLKSSQFDVFSELDNCTSTCLSSVKLSRQEWNNLHYPQATNTVPFIRMNNSDNVTSANDDGAVDIDPILENGQGAKNDSKGLHLDNGRALQDGGDAVKQQIQMKSYWQYGKQWYYADPSTTNDNATASAPHGIYRSWYGGPAQYYRRIGDRKEADQTNEGNKGLYTGHYLNLMQQEG